MYKTSELTAFPHSFVSANVSSLAESDVETTFPVRFVLYYSKKNGQVYKYVKVLNKYEYKCMRKKLTLELGGNTTVYDALHKAVATVHSLNKYISFKLFSLFKNEF